MYIEKATRLDERSATHLQRGLQERFQATTLTMSGDIPSLS